MRPNTQLKRKFPALAAAVLGLALGGCTSDEIKDFLHVTGKVAYDTFKNASGSGDDHH
ncbi:MAG: hypothetical protein OXR84_00700 [Magnetovibrio sp.]|nr:hypothetical protein [Magnetovibrio sp.]